MKKILGILAAFVLLAACTESKEERIIEAFKGYVQNNFDNPDEIEEILSVNPVDTLSKKHIVEIVEISRNAAHLSDSITAIIQDSLFSQTFIGGDVRNQPTKAARKVMRNEDYKLAVRMISDIASEFLGNYDNFDEDQHYNNLINAKDTFILCYELKYRIKSNGTLKMKSIQAHSDSLINNVVFRNKDITLKEIGISDISENAVMLLDYYQNKVECGAKLCKIYRKILRDIEIQNELE